MSNKCSLLGAKEQFEGSHMLEIGRDFRVGGIMGFGIVEVSVRVEMIMGKRMLYQIVFRNESSNRLCLLMS